MSDTTTRESFMGETTSQQKGTRLKILTPKKMLQRLPIALAKIKAGNNSENLLMRSGRYYILCINQKKLLKSI